MDEAVIRILNSRDFWFDRLAVGGSSPFREYSALLEHPIELRVSRQFALLLRIPRFQGIWEARLFLQADKRLHHLGLDDGGDCRQALFRWEELEAFATWLSRRHRSQRLFGLSVLLLNNFTPITESDDVDAVVALLERCWRSLRLFGESEVKRFAARTPEHRSFLRWERVGEPAGWQLAGKHVRKSPRRPGNADFPFELFEGFCTAALQRMAE